jgi:hypothetical protein
MMIRQEQLEQKYPFFKHFSQEVKTDFTRALNSRLNYFLVKKLGIEEKKQRIHYSLRGLKFKPSRAFILKNSDEWFNSSAEKMKVSLSVLSTINDVKSLLQQKLVDCSLPGIEDKIVSSLYSNNAKDFIQYNFGEWFYLSKDQMIIMISALEIPILNQYISEEDYWTRFPVERMAEIVEIFKDNKPFGCWILNNTFDWFRLPIEKRKTAIRISQDKGANSGALMMLLKRQDISNENLHRESIFLQNVTFNSFKEKNPAIFENFSEGQQEATKTAFECPMLRAYICLKTSNWVGNSEEKMQLACKAVKNKMLVVCITDNYQPYFENSSLSQIEATIVAFENEELACFISRHMIIWTSFFSSDQMKETKAAFDKNKALTKWIKKNYDEWFNMPCEQMYELSTIFKNEELIDWMRLFLDFSKGISFFEIKAIHNAIENKTMPIWMEGLHKLDESPKLKSDVTVAAFNNPRLHEWITKIIGIIPFFEPPLEEIQTTIVAFKNEALANFIIKNSFEWEELSYHQKVSTIAAFNGNTEGVISYFLNGNKLALRDWIISNPEAWLSKNAEDMWQLIDAEIYNPTAIRRRI